MDLQGFGEDLRAMAEQKVMSGNCKLEELSDAVEAKGWMASANCHVLGIQLA